MQEKSDLHIQNYKFPTKNYIVSNETNMENFIEKKIEYKTE